MISRYCRLFELLDNYSRTEFGCFLAELDLTKDRREYRLCFRRLSVSKDSPNRHACGYLHIDVKEAKCAVDIGSPSLAITEQLAMELTALGKLV